jgi:hypothetical protein
VQQIQVLNIYYCLAYLKTTRAANLPHFREATLNQEALKLTSSHLTRTTAHLKLRPSTLHSISQTNKK